MILRERKKGAYLEIKYEKEIFLSCNARLTKRTPEEK